MSTAPVPDFKDIVLIQLRAKARKRWASHNDAQDQFFDRLCRAYADLAGGLQQELDPDDPLVQYGTAAAVMQQCPRVPLELAAVQAMTWIKEAFDAATESLDRLDEYVEATAGQLELLGRDG